MMVVIRLLPVKFIPIYKQTQPNIMPVLECVSVVPDHALMGETTYTQRIISESVFAIGRPTIPNVPQNKYLKS
jgi:hypothetical protein